MIVLVDGNNLAARSFHAAKGQLTANGMETGSLHLFINSFAKHVREETPDRLVVCWDSPEPGYRHSLFPAYKANRRAAVQREPGDPEFEMYRLIKEFLSLCGIGQWSRPGQEADDLIAMAHYRYPYENQVILSADKDLLQLLDGHTEQVRFSSHNTPTDRWTALRVINEMGMNPKDIPLFMALTGDASDGIPGVRGIGPKKAMKILEDQNWDLGNIIEAYPEWAEAIKLSYSLVRLDMPERPWPDVPVFDPLPRHGSDYDVQLRPIQDFCVRWELRQVLNKITSGTLWEDTHALLDFDRLN